MQVIVMQAPRSYRKRARMLTIKPLGKIFGHSTKDLLELGKKGTLVGSV